ncbi:hypothetical protein F5888DRAFT_1807836 [Russula emetica]|nr:hypothetical protein F5888DRAFT_1807836 [Russula emetica]
MNLPPPPNGLIAPHYAPCIQPPLPPQQPGPDVSQLNPPDTHLNNTHHPEPSNNVDPFPITASNVPRSSVQNVNPPSQPFLTNGQISSWDCIWPLLIPPMPDRSSHHSSTSQNTQAASACHTCPTHATSGPVQFGGGRPAPAVQDLTAPSAAAAPSSSSSCPNPTVPYTAPPVPEVPLFRPGVADTGPTTANAYARRSKRMRPRRAREVPFVRIEDRIEWVSRDVMKMTLWFNWSPDAEAEAHETWE